MSDDGGRRPKRRCARSRFATTSLPSAVHYVGYVEDDETPEMIMAKFAELERIQKVAEEKAKQAAAEAPAAAEADAAGPSGEGSGGQAACGSVGPAEAGREQALTDEQLMEVFKQTSMFNVKTALEDNAMLMAIDDLLDANEERYGDDEDFSEGEDLIRAFWSDDEDELDLFAEEDDEGTPRRGRRRGAGGMERAGSGVARLPRSTAGVKARHNVVTTFNAQTQALIRRKVRVADREEVVQVKIPPPPIPLAWGRTVRAYAPPDARSERKMAVPCVGAPTPAESAVCYREVAGLAAAAREACGSAPFQAVLVSPGWWEGAAGPGGDAVQRLAKLPLPTLVPTGFIFVWVQKQHIHQVCRLMNRWGYVYVENLTWVWLGPGAHVLAQPSPLVRASHLTLFIFRKEGEGKDIELRHQRNPDVTFDCVAREPSGAPGVPEEAFVAIETLLPTGKGKFLELWAPRGVRRPGWTHLVEVGVPEA